MSLDNENNKNVGLFFESYAKSFDSIYGHNNKRSIIGRINDRFFRRAMYSRFEKTINMVNIDTVYQRVLALANKEQRGYVTPQEFNLLANQAQQELFEQYIYDLNQRLRIEPVELGISILGKSGERITSTDVMADVGIKEQHSYCRDPCAVYVLLFSVEYIQFNSILL